MPCQLFPPILYSRETVTRIVTQASQLDTDQASHLVSLIVTDKNWTPQSSVEPSERVARYDGVLYFGPYILTLENKPYSESIWEEQLNPGLGKNPGTLVTVPLSLTSRPGPRDGRWPTLRARWLVRLSPGNRPVSGRRDVPWRTPARPSPRRSRRT